MLDGDLVGAVKVDPLEILNGPEAVSEFCRTVSGGFEAYSWGVCEYESEDCGDGFREGFQWSSVAGVQDSPGLDVRDDSLDRVADLVDCPVTGLVVGMERQVRRFSLRGDHAQPDVALVFDMLRR